MDMVFLPERTQFFHVPIKLAQPFPAPELADNNFMDTRIFLKMFSRSCFFFVIAGLVSAMGSSLMSSVSPELGSLGLSLEKGASQEPPSPEFRLQLPNSEPQETSQNECWEKF